MIYSAIDIAKYVINKCTLDKKPISNLQLQGILYFLQRSELQTMGQPLFSDDIEAWEYGTFVPEVYWRFCGFGSMDIAMNFAIDIEKENAKYINATVGILREYDGLTLLNGTKNKAWQIVYGDGSGKHKIVPKELIRRKG